MIELCPDLNFAERLANHAGRRRMKSSAFTYCVALPILRGEDGELYAGDGEQCQSSHQAVR